MGAIQGAWVETADLKKWTARLHVNDKGRGSVFSGGVQFTGTPEDFDALAELFHLAADDLRIKQNENPQACDGSQFPESSDEYPIGSAPGVAA